MTIASLRDRLDMPERTLVVRENDNCVRETQPLNKHGNPKPSASLFLYFLFFFFLLI